LINFSFYKLLPVTLTVPAITGFILTIGMAVDANILVFERMKEELRRGRGMRNAVEAGFERAWPSIRDGNLSTLITAFILFWFGSSFGASIVKGFAVTLGIGVVVNLFTAVTVTRALMRLAVFLFGDAMQRNSGLLVGFNPDTGEKQLPDWVRDVFHIVQKRRWFYIFSAMLIVPGLIVMLISMTQFGTPFKLSIDYTGGSVWERRFEAIGPTIGREVTRASGVAVGVASLAILAFIWYAFRTVQNSARYGVSAIVAMLHDVLVTAGFYSLAGLIWGWELDTLFLTAILTVIGYSVNDTIVVFDRLRENLPRYRGESFDAVANRSLLETLHRSLLPAGLTLPSSPLCRCW